MSPSPPTPWSSPTPTTPRCWCGGQRMVTPLWSSPPNTDLFHWPHWPWTYLNSIISYFLFSCSRSSPALLSHIYLFCLSLETTGKNRLLVWGVSYVHFTTGVNKLQPFYLLPGSGLTVLKMKNRRVCFLLEILYIGHIRPSDMRFVSVADLKYCIHDHVCTYYIHGSA